MSNNMYVYATSQNDVLYVNVEGDLRLIAIAEQAELIEIGMEAAGVDIVHLGGPHAAIEEGIDVTVISEEVGEELSQRVMAFVEANAE